MHATHDLFDVCCFLEDDEFVDTSHHFQKKSKNVFILKDLHKNTPQTMSIDAICIIGRDNDPLYFQSYNISNNGENVAATESMDNNDSTILEPDPDFYLRLLMYSALDLVEERSRGLAEKNVYLGQLCTGDQRKVYGFVTTTSIKFMVALTDEGNDGKGILQDSTMRDFFRNIHGIFVDTMSNPFSQTTQSGTSSARDAKFIPSKRFRALVEKVKNNLETTMKK